MPGGLLDMFGIDPVANRQRKDAIMLQQLQNQGQLDVEKERNAGSLAVTREAGTVAEKKAQLDAMLKWAEANGLSPDAISTLKKERDQLDKTKIGTKQTDAEVSDVQSKSRGAQYGVNPLPGGVNPVVAEGIKRSVEAEAVAPAQQYRKQAAIDISKPLVLPNLDNPLKNSISPYLGLTKTGGYFDTKSGTMVPERQTEAVVPGMPLFTEADIKQAEAEEAAAEEAARLKNVSPNASHPMFGKGLGVLALPGVTTPEAPAEPATMLSSLLKALRSSPNPQPQPALFPKRFGGY